MGKWILLFVAALLLACESPPPPIRIPPPITGPIEASLPDETEMWERADEIEEGLADSDLHFGDEALEARLGEMVAVLLESLGAAKAPARVILVRFPEFHASALPNGLVVLSTHVFAELENESALAAALAHELVHFVERHALREQRLYESRKGVYDFEASLAIASNPGGDGMRLFVSRKISAYSRELEAQADLRGFLAIRDAGWDAEAAMQLLDLLHEYERTEGPPDDATLMDHPTASRRTAAIRAALAAAPATDSTREETVGALLPAVLIADAEAGLDERNAEAAGVALDRHDEIHRETGRSLFLRGEARRFRAGSSEPWEEVVALYDRAIALDPELADAHRERGLALRALGRDADALNALRRAVELDPAAALRPILDGYIAELEESLR